MNAIDPVCGKEVDTLRARAVAIVDGVTHYFCSAAHKEQFLRERGRTPTPVGVPVEKPPVAEKKTDAPEKAAAPEKVAAREKIAAPEKAASAAAPSVSEAPAEVRIARPRRAGPLRYVLVVLLAAAIAVAWAMLSRHGQ